MTISQSSSSPGSSPASTQLRSLWLAPWALYRAVARWSERRRVSADLKRMAEAGDYLLLDIGLDPELVRKDPAALLDQLTRRR